MVQKEMNNSEASHRGINTQEGTQKMFSLLSPTPHLRCACLIRHVAKGPLRATSLKTHCAEVAT